MQNPISIHHYRQVYYVETDHPFIGGPIAISPMIFDDTITWQDTSKGRIIKIEKINNKEGPEDSPPDKIEVTTKNGYKIRLIKMTMEIYYKSVKQHVILPQDFKSDEDLQEFYLKTDFSLPY